MCSSPCPWLILTPCQRTQLEQLVACHTEQAQLVLRARIILLCAEGQIYSQIARKLGITRKTVQRWHDRFVHMQAAEPEKPVRAWLQDVIRTGAPDRIPPEVWVDIMALATTDPQSLGLPFTLWSSRELERQAIARNIVPRIDHSTIARFLQSVDLKPHQVRSWMNRKHDPDFEARATQVKAVLADAVQQPDPTHAVISYDEKTGIQAKQRIAADKPPRPGQPTKQESEYIRHGTLMLLAAMVVHTGEVLGDCRPQRTNEDTHEVLKRYLTCLLLQGYRRITVVLDQLNTHGCLLLIQTVAKLCGLPQPDPKKEVDTLKKRRAWLGRKDKPIVFLFTPLHASWLNPIEMWFSVLVRKLLRRGSFSSLEELQQRIYAFIAYYNQHLAHPYRLRQWHPKPRPRARRPHPSSCPAR